MQFAHALVLPLRLGASQLWVSQLVNVGDPLLGRACDPTDARRLKPQVLGRGRRYERYASSRELHAAQARLCLVEVVVNQGYEPYVYRGQERRVLQYRQ